MPWGSIRSSRPSLIFGVLAAIFLLLPLTAQTPTNTSEANQPAIQLKAESNLVVVPVVVRDGEGHPVDGLTREDFKVFDRGKEQTISQFEAETPTAPTTPQAVPQNLAGQLAGPSTERLLALYFDNLDTTADEMIQARDAADRYLSEHLGPNDRVAVLTPEKVLTDFTGDPKQIHDALFQLQASARSRPRVHMCPDLSDYQAMQLLETTDTNSDAWMTALAEAQTCEVSFVSSNAGTSGSSGSVVDPRAMVAIQMMARKIVDQARILAESNLDGLRQLVNYMARLPGERAVLLISPGFLSESAQYDLDRLINSALRSQVVIDSLDPKGLKFESRESDASRSSVVLADPRATEARENMDAAQRFVGADVLAEVAEGTGGEFVHNENDLTTGFEALAGEQGHYLLAFMPRDLKRDGKFRELKVTLAGKKKGYSIQARRGYYVPKQGEEVEEAQVAPPVPTPATAAAPAAQKPASQPAAAGGQSQIDEALRGTSESDQLRIGIEVKAMPGQGGLSQLSVLTHLDVTTLPMKKEGDHSLNELTFAVGIFDRDGKAVEVKERRARVDLSQDQMADFLSNGVEVQTAFQLKPGDYRLRVVVSEADENKLATLNRQVTVP